MVLQEPHLFHGTILETIRYGLPEGKLEEVVDAAKAANAHDFVCELAHGYDTVVGERGQTLSGGERQRISIIDCTGHSARSAHPHPRLGNAHRLSTLRRATRLLVIKNGRIVEAGTHRELLAKADGVYKRLHDMQRELQVGA